MRKSIVPVLFLFLLAACETTLEDLTPADAISDYSSLPAQVGKRITYRVDSLVFTNFGRSEVTRKYQMKDSVQALLSDNLGRAAYRVYRYLSDSAGTAPWQPIGSYWLTVLNDQVETTEDNLRSIRLHYPLRNNTTWKGFRYIQNDPYGGLYNFSNDDAMNQWDFYIDGDKTSAQIGGQTIPDVFTVVHINESINVPITNPTGYASLTKSIDQFAKGIGLVSREHTLWEYQPNLSGSGGPYKTGFGIKMWMISHN